MLLKAICLRRTRDILGLPDSVADVRPLEFSEEERHQYDELYEHYRKQVQMAVSGFTNVASTTLQSIHELRLFCNNGPRRTQKDLYESEDERLSYLQQLDQNVCANCSLPIFWIDQRGDGNGGTFIPSCKHLVCHSCFPQCFNKQRVCLLCSSGNVPPDLPISVGTFGLTNGPIPASEGHTFEYPSKLVALLQDLQMEPRCKR